MNEEQNNPGEASEAPESNSKVFTEDGTLQTEKGFEDEKNNEVYYEVDNPKKEVISNIGDGEMSNEGTVGMGDMPEEPTFSTEGTTED